MQRQQRSRPRSHFTLTPSAHARTFKMEASPSGTSSSPSVTNKLPRSRCCMNLSELGNRQGCKCLRRCDRVYIFPVCMFWCVWKLCQLWKQMFLLFGGISTRLQLYRCFPASDLHISIIVGAITESLIVSYSHTLSANLRGDRSRQQKLFRWWWWSDKEYNRTASIFPNVHSANQSVQEF